jgi:hypothetical protein
MRGGGEKEIIMRVSSFLFIPLLLTVSIAQAADPPSGSTSPPADQSAPSDKPSVATDQPVTAPATAPAKTPSTTPDITLTPGAATTSPEAAKAQAELNRIRARAGAMDPKEKETSEKSLKETAADVDAATKGKEKVEVAGRLAAQFGGIPELYLGEHDRLKSGWGELAIAHTLLANAKTVVTIDQLYDLRQEGIGWGQIAHGLDLSVGEFVRMAQSNGKSAVSAPGAGAKSDQVEAKADPGSKAKGKGAAKVPALKADTGAKAVEPSMKSEAGAAAEKAKK